MHEPELHRDLVVRKFLINIATKFGFGTKTPSQPCTLSTRLIGPIRDERDNSGKEKKR